MKREIYMPVTRDLARKMVLLSVPRQVGKTYLAKKIMAQYERPVYLNFDNINERKVIEEQGWSTRMKILVTGSARLETFRQSGDSLAGRYYHHRLIPVTPAEANYVYESFSISHFMKRGGFPEPLLEPLDDDAGRWRRLYADGLIREDVLTFDNISQLKAMNLLVELLRNRVASPLSYQSLSEDIGIAPNTVKHYIDILESLYVVFRVYPYHRSIARSIKKQSKFYFFDNGMVKGDDGVKFENLVAVSLLRQLYLLEDRDGKLRQLCYLRTRGGTEVDFIITEDGRPLFMVETKDADRRLSHGLAYFSNKYGFPGIRVVRDLPVENESGILHLRRAEDWLKFVDVLN